MKQQAKAAGSARAALSAGRGKRGGGGPSLRRLRIPMTAKRKQESKRAENGAGQKFYPQAAA